MRLLAEALARGFIGERPGRQHLQRDFTIELRVARAVYLAHPPRTEGGEDFVAPETIAW